MLSGGSWIAPSLAGEPFLREPPLYYLTAALSATSFLPAAAARRRTARDGFLHCDSHFFLALAARELNGRGHGTWRLALLIGCFGLVLRSHQLIPRWRRMAGFAMASTGVRCAAAPFGGFGWAPAWASSFSSQGYTRRHVVLPRSRFCCRS